MSLTGKLRELAERLESRASGHTSGPISHAKAMVYLSIKMDLAPLLAEAERLEAQNRRLRGLVRKAYEEGFSDCPVYGDVDEDLAWSKSSSKAALDVMDKEGTDEA